MGARQPLLLQSGSPPSNDPGIRAVLDLCAAVLSAKWVRLVLEWERDGSSSSYEHGPCGDGGASSRLDIGDAVSATLSYDRSSTPPAGAFETIGTALVTVLECHRLRSQTVVLRAALDSTSSAVLLFDGGGDIVYANPPADALLSLQTEDELLVEIEGESSRPLFTVLASLVDHVASSGDEKSAWQGTMQSLDGRVLACEVTRLPHSTSRTEIILVLLQTLVSERAVRIEAFCSAHNLSPREHEVMRLLVDGLTTGAMADRLGISPHTVRDHLKNLYRKTGTRSRGELLGLASRTNPTQAAKRS